MVMDGEPAREFGRREGMSRRTAFRRIGAGGLAAGGLAAAVGRVAAAQGTSDEANEALIRRYYDALNGRDAEALGPLFAPDFVDHAGGGESNLEAFGRGLDQSLTAFPDQEATVDELVVDGNEVWVRWTFTGTQRGPLDEGVPATGRAVEVTNVDIFRVSEAGRIAEHWAVYDNLGLLLQLGFQLVPPAVSPAQATPAAG